MKKIPKYLNILISKHPSILGGRKNLTKNHERIIKIKKLIKDFCLKNNLKSKF